MFVFLAAFVAAVASPVCHDSDLITPSTVAPVTGSILIQSAPATRPEPRLPKAEKAALATTFPPWNLLFLLQGDGSLLDVKQKANEEGALATAFLLGVGFLLLVWLIYACVAVADSAPKAPPAPRSSTAGPRSSRSSLEAAGPCSLRPTLEPLSRKSGRPTLPPILQAPTPEETTSSIGTGHRTSSVGTGHRTSSVGTGHRLYTSTCCPSLVVPAGTQSVIGVPSLGALDATGLLDIVDPTGKPLLQVEVSQALSRQSQFSLGPASAASAAPEVEVAEPILLIRNLDPAQSVSLLKTPRSSFVDTPALVVSFLRQTGQERRLEICCPDMSVFGYLEEESRTRSVLRAGRDRAASMVFHTSGNCGRTGVVTVTDESNRVVARTLAESLNLAAPQGSFFSLQVQPGVDVGVLLSCLFFLDGVSTGIF